MNSTSQSDCIARTAQVASTRCAWRLCAFCDQFNYIVSCELATDSAAAASTATPQPTSAAATAAAARTATELMALNSTERFVQIVIN